VPAAAGESREASTVILAAVARGVETPAAKIIKIMPTEIRTSSDLLNVLFREIRECSEGRTDAARSHTICRLVDAAVKLARLQMEANADEDKARGIALLKYEPNEGELDRATARLEEIEKAIRVVEKAVDDPKTDEAKLPALQAKLNNLRQEQLNLRRVLAKRA
jgi:hypothetical protein